MQSLNKLPILYLVLAIFAVFRLAKMIAQEEGPFSIFDKIRSIGKNVHWWQDGINCPYCISFWLALLAGLLLIYPTDIGSLILLWLGIAGIVALLLDIKEYLTKL